MSLNQLRGFHCSLELRLHLIQGRVSCGEAGFRELAVERRAHAIHRDAALRREIEPSGVGSEPT